MPRFRVPERYLPALLKISSLDNDSVDKIVAIVREFPATSHPPELGERMHLALPHFSREDADDLSSVVTSLYGLRLAAGVSIEQLSSDLSEAFVFQMPPEKGVQSGSQERLRDNLRKFLAVDSYGAAVKARDLQTEHDKVFCEARVLTDLRPVFGQRIEDGPEAVVVVHLLKLGYHQGGERHLEFYLALDSEDLATLKSALERAEAKGRVLKARLPETGFGNVYL